MATREPEDVITIDRYVAAKKRQTTARRTIGLTLLCVLVAYIFMIREEALDFREDTIPHYSAVLSAEMAEYMPQLVEEAADMERRAARPHLEAFADIYHARSGDYSSALEEVFGRLRERSEPALDSMARELEDIAATEARDFRRQVAGKLPAEESERLGAIYEEALRESLVQRYRQEHGNLCDLGSNIETNLRQLVEEIDAGSSPGERAYLFGVHLILTALSHPEWLAGDGGETEEAQEAARQ